VRVFAACQRETPRLSCNRRKRKCSQFTHLGVPVRILTSLHALSPFGAPIALRQIAAMATTTANEPAKPKPKSKSKLPLILIAAVLVVGAGAGGWMWKRSSAKAQPAAPQTADQVNSVLQLDSFVVNLQDPSGNGYLRVGITLGLGTPASADDKDKQAAYLPHLRDTILGVLGTRTVDDLLTPDGKTKLKSDLLQAINANVPELQCKEVYFTEFLVQH
jgi:flagellar FliL protein